MSKKKLAVIVSRRQNSQTLSCSLRYVLTKTEQTILYLDKNNNLLYASRNNNLQYTDKASTTPVFFEIK